MFKGETKARIKRLISEEKYWWLVAGIFTIARVATWLFPFDSDHWIFYYVGKHWLNGDVLYLQVWDHKAPLIFAINAMMHALFGANLFLQRAFFTLITVLAVWVFYLAAMKLFANIGRKTFLIDARVATLLFVFWANLSQFTNSGNDTENFGILAVVVALYCYLRFIDSKLWKWLFYSGIAVSCMVVLKINFSILVVPLIIDFVVRYRRSPREFLKLGFIWILPTIIQIGAWVSYFAPRHIIRELWIASISFNSKYLRAGWKGALSGQFIFIAILLIGFAFFTGGFYYLWTKRKTEKNNLLLLGIGGSAIFFSVILGTFYDHYYLIVIPYFCLISGAYWRQIVRSRLWLTIALLSMIASFGISTKQLYNRFYGSAAIDARNMKAAALYVQERTSPSDTIIFDGYGATFYQLAQRDSGSRYISASHPLIDEREKFGYDFDKKYIGDMATTKPKYVIIDLATKAIYSENKLAVTYFENHYSLETTLPGYEILRIK